MVEEGCLGEAILVAAQHRAGPGEPSRWWKLSLQGWGLSWAELGSIFTPALP
jgi:hypothetical protein